MTIHARKSYPPFWMFAKFITRLDDTNALVIRRATLCSESVLPQSVSPVLMGLLEHPVVYCPGLDVDDTYCGKTCKSGQYDPVA